MPYLRISTNTPLSTQAKVELLDSLADILPTLPEKNINNAMIQIEGDCFISLGNPKDNCAFCDIRVFGASPENAKKQFIYELSLLLEEKLQIESKQIYINFSELNSWGVNKDFISL